MATRKVVPFGRPLKMGMRGTDVRAVQRVLARDKVGGTLKGATGVYGIRTRSRVKKAQKKYGLPASGVYGLNLHARLAPDFAPFDVFLYTGVNPNETKEQKLRRLIVAAALSFYAHGAHCHYTMGPSRMTIVRKKLKSLDGVELYEDCSSSCTGFYYMAGAPDPNGNGYNLEGFTGTLWARGRLVTLAQAQPGDLVFYKSPSYPGFPYAHVAVYIGGGKVISFGSEPPRILPIDYRTGAYGRVGIRSYI